MGAAGVELDAAGDLSPKNLSQTGRRELLHLLRGYQLELSAVGCPLRHGLDAAENQEARIDHVRQVMALSFDLGPRIVIVHAGQVGDGSQESGGSDPRLVRLTDSLTALGRHGDRIGATLALETGLDSPALLDSYLATFDVGSLAVSFSPAHLLINGHNPYEAARILGRRIVTAHAGDARVTTLGRAAQEVPLGHGDIDWLQMLGSLEEIGYTGWLACDRLNSADPLGDLSGGVQFLRRLVR